MEAFEGWKEFYWLLGGFVGLKSRWWTRILMFSSIKNRGLCSIFFALSSLEDDLWVKFPMRTESINFESGWCSVKKTTKHKAGTVITI